MQPGVMPVQLRRGSCGWSVQALIRMRQHTQLLAAFAVASILVRCEQARRLWSRRQLLQTS